MRFFSLYLLLGLMLPLGTISKVHAEGKFLEGCYSIMGNEDQFKKTTVTWVAEEPGKTIVAYAVLNEDGRTAVCGLYINDGAVPEKDLNASLSKSEMRVGQQTLIRNLSFFKNACKGDECRLCAPCFLTSLDWKPAYLRAKLYMSPTENFQMD